MPLCARCKSEAEYTTHKTTCLLGTKIEEAVHGGERDTDADLGLAEGEACDRCGLSPADVDPAQ